MEVDDVERALKLLESTPGVSRIERDAAGISMTLTGVDRKTIVAALANTGIGVETIEARHRLEDAFLGIVEKAEP